jgi:hypothetical protein
MAKAKGNYTVLNPRNIPKGRWVIRVGERRWFEGDTLDGTEISAGDLKSFIERGFLEVNDG